MAMIKGITVVLQQRTPIGTDAFNRDTYTETSVNVDNVLVAPSSADDVTTSQELHGKKAVYTLAIPKGDTHDWNDAVVSFFGQQWHTVGFPLEGIEANIPLDWNKKVMVERYG